MVKYTGSSSKVKMRITGPNGIVYTYDLRAGQGFQAFPLTAGSGSYNINVFEHVVNSQYAMVMSRALKITLRDTLLPYLYPNQYVSYTDKSATVAKGEELAKTAASQMAVVQSVYNYVTSHLTYDHQKAAIVQPGYLPVVDSILASGKGICFDYAAVMATMLRTQNIPTRLEIGYVTGGLYHAWISVYLPEKGWLNGVIYFDGVTWKLMDPTFASSGNNSKSVLQFIANTKNYSVKYVY